MSRPARALPRDLCVDWPAVRSDDEVAETARQFALALRDAIGDRSLRSVGEVTGVTHATITRILDGRLWPDMVTLARLEIGLAVSLWPRRM